MNWARTDATEQAAGPSGRRWCTCRLRLRSVLQPTVAPWECQYGAVQVKPSASHVSPCGWLAMVGLSSAKIKRSALGENALAAQAQSVLRRGTRQCSLRICEDAGLRVSGPHTNSRCRAADLAREMWVSVCEAVQRCSSFQSPGNWRLPCVTMIG